ncbi:MAG: ribonuclease P protein component [Myxococcales bacterium]|nr:ribonuclease P protein component [Myxococcales bacterium]
MTVPRYDFPKAARLLSPTDFTRVMRNGRRVSSDHFVLFEAKPGTDRSRLGITVSKKVGNAVRRNQIKRWLRTTFRTRQAHFTRHVDLVIMAKKKASFEDISYQQTDYELNTAFTRLELLPSSMS